VAGKEEYHGAGVMHGFHLHDVCKG